MSILWKYFNIGNTRKNRITGTVQTKDYKGDWFTCSEETQQNFNSKIPIETKEYKELHDIILKHLEKEDRDYTRNIRYNRTQFVIDLCEEVYEYIYSKNNNVTMMDVILLDDYCSGHVDYHKKFALRSYELMKYGHTLD